MGDLVGQGFENRDFEVLESRGDPVGYGVQEGEVGVGEKDYVDEDLQG